MIKAYTHHPLGLAVVLGIKCNHDHSFRVSPIKYTSLPEAVYIYTVHVYILYTIGAGF